jgi:carboxyl-terminal processing protease
MAPPAASQLIPMNPFTKSLLLFVSASATTATSAAAFGFWNNEPVPLSRKETDSATTIVTAKLLEKTQFAHAQLDEKLANKFLDRYIDTLDVNHMLFLQSDLDDFAKSRPTLAKATREVGDFSLAHIIFKRYMERLDQRVASITENLSTGVFEFNTDDTFVYDRKKLPRPATLQEAKVIWNQQLRYEYLQEKLAGKKIEDIPKLLIRRSNRTVESMRKLTEQGVLEIYLEALAQTYDPHSDYMGPEQLKTFEIGMNLSLIGIGATLRTDDGFCKVVELVAGGPAERSGQIKSGDRIVGVAQKEGDEYTDLFDLPLSQAVEMIRGKKGTTVYLNIIPADATDDSIRNAITIVRDEIKLEDQQAKAQVIDFPIGDQTRRVGVINLPTFYAGEGDGKGAPTSATADVEKLIRKLKKENVTGIILDLRRNGGGSLQEAIDLTGLFVSTGPVVQTRNYEGRLEVGKDRDEKVAYDGPLVVLTSRFSASASEIVAGALQDYGRALVVGDTSTFGKGTVQTIVPLSRIMQQDGIVPGADPGAVKVTISKFYRPSGKSTQLEGVKADIVIPSLSDLPEIGESDLQNPLPWDTIAAVDYSESNLVAPSLAKLRERSKERVEQDIDFSELKAEALRFAKLREDKSVSLNETKRRTEKDQLKAKAEKLKKDRIARLGKPVPAFEVTLKNVDTPGLNDLVKVKKPPLDLDADADASADAADDTPAADIILDEAQRILIDYSDLLKGQPVVSLR